MWNWLFGTLENATTKIAQKEVDEFTLARQKVSAALKQTEDRKTARIDRLLSEAQENHK